MHSMPLGSLSLSRKQRYAAMNDSPHGPSFIDAMHGQLSASSTRSSFVSSLSSSPSTSVGKAEGADEEGDVELISTEAELTSFDDELVSSDDELTPSTGGDGTAEGVEEGGRALSAAEAAFKSALESAFVMLVCVVADGDDFDVFIETGERFEIVVDRDGEVSPH